MTQILRKLNLIIINCRKNIKYIVYGAEIIVGCMPVLLFICVPVDIGVMISAMCIFILLIVFVYKLHKTFRNWKKINTYKHLTNKIM